MIKYNVVSTASKIKDYANNLILTELKKNGIRCIVPSHGDILVCLFEQDELSVNELASKIYRTQPTVTVLVDKLVEIGYVKRVKSKEDKRVTLISLTEEGRELKPVFQQISDKLNDTVYKNLTDGEKEQLEELLEKALKGF